MIYRIILTFIFIVLGITQISMAGENTDWKNEVKMKCAAIGGQTGIQALVSRKDGMQKDALILPLEEMMKSMGEYEQYLMRINIKIIDTIYKKRNVTTKKDASDEGYKICIADWLKYDPNGEKKKKYEALKEANEIDTAKKEEAAAAELEAESAIINSTEKIDVAKLQAELDSNEKEIGQLNGDIEAVKSKIGTAAAGPNDTLETMTALIDKKGKLEQRTKEIKRVLKIEERKRQAESTRSKDVSNLRRIASIVQDIANFEKIASSAYGKELAPTAWKGLIAKYADNAGTKNLSVGNVRALKDVLIGKDFEYERYGFLVYKKNDSRYSYVACLVARCRYE